MAPVAPPLVDMNHTAAEMLEFAHNINVPRAIAALSEEARQIEDVIGRRTNCFGSANVVGRSDAVVKLEQATRSLSARHPLCSR